MDRINSLIQKHLLKKVAVIVAGMMLSLITIGVPGAYAWWDGKWPQRKKIQFDESVKGADIKDTLTDVPVLIRLHTGNFTFASAKADGSDLRFVGSDDKSPLKYHVEKFDPNEEIALIWVKVPRLSGGPNQDFIWMYYGNSSAPDAQDAGGTYDVNQVAVYHFSEKEGNPRDATAYANHTAGFTGKLGIPSAVGNGAQFDGASGGQMTIARSPSLSFVKGFTFSAWVRLVQSSGSAQLFSWDDGLQSIVIGIDNGNAYCSLGYGKGLDVATPKTAALSPGRWQHLAVTVDPEKQITLYVDGKEASTSSLNRAIPAPSADIIVGGAAKGGNAFIGDLDEVQLSNVARSAGWVKAAFQSQVSDSPLTSYMEEESGGGGGGESLTVHLMKVIIRTITLDGWLIIGFLVIMGSGSLFVFRQKVVTLNQAKKDNSSFTQSFRGMENMFSLLSKEEDFPGSPLYRVYQAGCEELKPGSTSKGKATTDGKGLSVKVMKSFEAALAKAAMYESRSLSAGMVIMNMSVAGGPFLGLLGTVWGVMNTFASLAESGEANLTAIAPGVASALSCTLAGLLVAIPSLFASSYVTGRIKDMNADVNVFIDDFILRLEGEMSDAPREKSV